jgi:hypothetical protein
MAATKTGIIIGAVVGGCDRFGAGDEKEGAEYHGGLDRRRHDGYKFDTIKRDVYNL